MTNELILTNISKLACGIFVQFKKNLGVQGKTLTATRNKKVTVAWHGEVYNVIQRTNQKNG